MNTATIEGITTSSNNSPKFLLFPSLALFHHVVVSPHKQIIVPNACILVPLAVEGAKHWQREKNIHTCEADLGYRVALLACLNKMRSALIEIATLGVSRNEFPCIKAVDGRDTIIFETRFTRCSSRKDGYIPSAFTQNRAT